MDQNLLVVDEIEAAAEFVRRFDDYAPVKAAFWLRIEDELTRYLHVASDQIDSSNFDLAYGEVVRLAREMRNPNFDVFRVKVIYGTDPKAMAAAVWLRGYIGSRPIRRFDIHFGDCHAEELYIYPPLHPASVA